MNDYELIAQSDAIYLDTCALVKIDYEEKWSRFIRVLIYNSVIKKYSSQVGLAEWICVMSRKIKESSDLTFLFNCRQAIKEFEINHFNIIEPPDNRLEFINLSDRLLKNYQKIDGSDMWHLMAALELKKMIPNSVFISFDKNLINAANLERLIAVNGQQLSEEILNEELKKSGKCIGN